MEIYSAKAVANAFLQLADSEGKEITPMKIQKLVYIAHGWALGVLGQPFITEDIQAWKYGPVIQDLYHEFKRYGSGPITDKATNVDLDSNTLKIIVDTPMLNDTDTDANALVKKIWEVYGKFSGPQLSNITHMPNTPWDVTYNGDHQRKIISNDVIKPHYQELMQKRAQK